MDDGHDAEPEEDTSAASSARFEASHRRRRRSWSQAVQLACVLVQSDQWLPPADAALPHSGATQQKTVVAAPRAASRSQSKGTAARRSGGVRAQMPVGITPGDRLNVTMFLGPTCSCNAFIHTTNASFDVRYDPHPKNFV